MANILLSSFVRGAPGLVSANVIDSIADGDAVNAPSRNAVFDALAGKEATGVAATLDAAHVAAGDPHPQYALDTDLTGYQPLDSDLTSIAGLAPTNDDIIQRKAGAWINRTMAQLKVDLNLSGTNTGDQDLSTYALTSYVVGKVIDSIADSDTTHAPSRNAVFDALALKQDTIPWTTIAGTADALTANFSPDFSVVDGKMFRARALLANATTTPTLAIDGAAPFTIVKKGSSALAAGDISGPDHELLFVVHDYFTHYEYELINPATDATGGGGRENLRPDGGQVRPDREGRSFVRVQA